MNLNIRILQLKDITKNYIEWYSDKEVTKFSDNQYKNFSLDGQYQYIATCLESSTLDLYGIFDDKFHVGNIEISNIDSTHKRAEIAYVVGEKKYWGKGIGAFAISKIIELAITKYNLNKLIAGLAEGNKGSQRVLEKNGFILEGCQKNYFFYNGIYYNRLLYGLIL